MVEKQFMIMSSYEMTIPRSLPLHASCRRYASPLLVKSSCTAYPRAMRSVAASLLEQDLKPGGTSGSAGFALRSGSVLNPDQQTKTIKGVFSERSKTRPRRAGAGRSSPKQFVLHEDLHRCPFEIEPFAEL